jgi:hypothetical protein
MFAERQVSFKSSAPLAAADQALLWENTLSLRISLQRSLDVASKLPESKTSAVLKENNEVAEECEKLCSGLRNLINDLSESLTSQISDKGEASHKRLRESNDITWDDVQLPQKQMRSNWESVVNKWHARLHFGSEQVKSKMKIFNQTIWEQVGPPQTNRLFINAWLSIGSNDNLLASFFIIDSFLIDRCGTRRQHESYRKIQTALEGLSANRQRKRLYGRSRC